MRSEFKACIISNGCPEGRIDTAAVEKFIRGKGWKITPSFRDADLIVFNACGATLHAQESSLGIIGEIERKKRADSKLVICGCLIKINNKIIESKKRDEIYIRSEIKEAGEIMGIDIPSDISANHLVPIRFRWNISFFDNRSFLLSIPKFLTRLYHLVKKEGVNNIGERTFCIKVATGCSHACSFCAIRLARGNVTSKSPGEVIREFHDGMARGFRKFTLIATDLGSYGIDNGTDLCGLLEKLTALDGDFSIKLQYIHPRFLIDMRNDLKNVLKTGKISYVCFAAESGNDRVLKLMKRNYSVEEFKRAVVSLRRQFPEIKMSTQVILAFPTESEDEFEDTLQLLDETRFDFVEAYVYQPRPDTAASRIHPRIPGRVAEKRLLKLYFRSFFRKYRVFVW